MAGRHGWADPKLVGLQTGDGLVLMDLHGLRERELYEAMGESQSVVRFPFSVSLSSEAGVVAPELMKLGFEITNSALAGAPKGISGEEPDAVAAAIDRVASAPAVDDLRLAIACALAEITLDLTATQDADGAREVYRQFRSRCRFDTCPHGLPIIIPMFMGKPLRTGNIVVTTPDQYFEPASGDIPLLIRAGISFGIGTHATTRLPLQFMQEYLKPGDVAADIGTGSGILAIAALKLGASRVFAVDTDPLAVEEARANLALNGLADRAFLALGSTDQLDGEFDLIVTNMNRPGSVLQIAPDVSRHLRSGGLFVASGIYGDDHTSLSEWDRIITSELVLHDLIVEARKEMDNCLGIVAIKRAQDSGIDTAENR